ncbi:MAG: hypothetical protein IT548_07205 [Alphaproteobacteria bacterium]|nr:hypothetical protein [Alphaproteobacteria bacterium]
MSVVRYLAPALALAAGLAGQAFGAEPACDLKAPMSAAELQKLLSLRAVEAIETAAQPVTAKTTARLEALIAPDAAVELGMGDVGGAYEPGLKGARDLAREMHANLYIFQGWDYIPQMLDTVCGEQKVSVEFLDNRVKQRCEIAFTFLNGRITRAAGWVRSYSTGRMTPPK